LYSAQNGADGGNGVCIIIEKIWRFLWIKWYKQ
jgi:hypothetical protein